MFQDSVVKILLHCAKYKINMYCLHWRFHHMRHNSLIEKMKRERRKIETVFLPFDFSLCSVYYLWVLISLNWISPSPMSLCTSFMFLSCYKIQLFGSPPVSLYLFVFIFFYYYFFKFHIHVMFAVSLATISCFLNNFIIQILRMNIQIIVYDMHIIYMHTCMVFLKCTMWYMIHSFWQNDTRFNSHASKFVLTTSLSEYSFSIFLSPTYLTFDRYLKLGLFFFLNVILDLFWQLMRINLIIWKIC